jgi:hypothetical protein
MKPIAAGELWRRLPAKIGLPGPALGPVIKSLAVNIGEVSQ